jgi:uncharacterized protein YjbI with pentapeptide repeats
VHLPGSGIDNQFGCKPPQGDPIFDDEVDDVRASELLNLYQLGERDFRGKDLRGVSLRGKNLSGIDLSYADLRGADFTNAILKGAHLNHIKAGLLPQQGMLFLLLLIGSSVFLGAAAGAVDALVELQFHTGSLGRITAKWLIWVALTIFTMIALREGIMASFSAFLAAMLLAGGIAFTAPQAVPIGAAIVVATTVASFVVVVTALEVILVMAAGYGLNRGAAVLVLSFFPPAFIAVAFPSARESAIALAIAVSLLTAHIIWRTLHGDEKHIRLQNLATNLAARWGTSFRDADLSDADFTQARLKSTDFSGARISYNRLRKRADVGRFAI